MRAVCYARVSSLAQRDRDTIASQLRTLPEFVTARGWELVRPADAYVDDGRTAKSGNLAARVGLTALLRDAALGLFDVVVVVDVDRLTRAEDLTERGAILGALQRAGVRVAAAASGQVLDLSTSSGDLLTSLHAYFAAEWGRKHRERIVQGKLTAMQRGRKPSGPTPYGLDYDRATGAWLVHHERGPIVIEIYERIIAGDTLRAIADDLELRGIARPRGAWDSSRVYAIVRSRHPVGEWTADKRRRIVITVPPIVTEAQWHAAQDALLAHRRRGLRRTQHVYLLEGLATCGACGARVHIRSACGVPRNKPAYVCSRRKVRPGDGERCDAPILLVEDVDARAWEAVGRGLEHPELVAHLARVRASQAAVVKDWTADAAGYRKHLDRLQRLEVATLGRHVRGLISDGALEAQLEALRREREAVRAQLVTAERASYQAAAERERLPELADVIAVLRTQATATSLEERRDLVQALIEPGGVVFEGRDLAVTLFVGPSSATEASRGPAGVDVVRAAAYSCANDTHVRIRVVA